MEAAAHSAKRCRLRARQLVQSERLRAFLPKRRIAGIDHPCRLEPPQSALAGPLPRNASSHDGSGVPQLFKTSERFSLRIVAIELADLLNKFHLRRPLECCGCLGLVDQVDPILFVAAGRVEHDRHRFRVVRLRPDNTATDPLPVCSMHDGDQLTGVTSGKTERRACDLRVSGNETGLTKVMMPSTRNHFHFERLGAGRDGHQAALHTISTAAFFNSPLACLPPFHALARISLRVASAYCRYDLA